MSDTTAAEPKEKVISLDALIASQEAQRARLEKEASQSESGGLSSPEKGLEILGTEPETLNTNMGPITVAPMCMDQIADFIGVAEHLIPLLSVTEKGGKLPIGKLLSTDKASLWKAVAIACNTSPEVIGKLLPQDFISVITKVFVVNLDFFVRTLPAALGVAERSVLKAVNSLVPAMPDSFKDLSNMGTFSRK